MTRYLPAFQEIVPRVLDTETPGADFRPGRWSLLLGAMVMRTGHDLRCALHRCSLSLCAMSLHPDEIDRDLKTSSLGLTVTQSTGKRSTLNVKLASPLLHFVTQSTPNKTDPGKGFTVEIV